MTYSSRVMLFDAAPGPTAPRRNNRPAPINAASARLRAHDRAAPIRASRVCGYTIPPEPRRVTLADIETMLTVLPYGRWIAEDGRVVIFNRHYTPIWERVPNGTVQRANPHEWICWVSQGWFGLGSMRFEKSAREAYRKVLRDFFDGKLLSVKTADEM
jgi:hypothetical protein